MGGSLVGFPHFKCPVELQTNLANKGGLFPSTCFLCLSPTWLTRCPLDTRPARWLGHLASTSSHDAPGACTPLASPSWRRRCCSTHHAHRLLPHPVPQACSPTTLPGTATLGHPGLQSPCSAKRGGECSPKHAGPDAQWPAASGWRVLQGDGSSPPRPRFNSGTRGAHGLRRPVRGRGHSRSPVSPLHSAPGIR